MISDCDHLRLKPYFAKNNVTIYNCDSLQVVEEMTAMENAFIIADPPYGIRERTNRKSSGRGRLAECNDFAPIIGDDNPFDPTPWLGAKKLVLWGANYFSNRLPASPTWLFWDKRDGLSSNDNADGELAWSNLGGPMRIFHHRWNGMIRDSEKYARRVHPTQKPVALMQWIISSFAKDGDIIIDPFMGSGPVLEAAVDLGYPAIGFDVVADYCEAARDRIERKIMFGVAYPEKKKCSGCGNTYQVHIGLTFNRKHGTADGLQPWCRSCDTSNKSDHKNGWKNFLRMLKASGEDLEWTEEKYLLLMGDFKCHSCGCDVAEWGGSYWVDRIQNDTGYKISNCRPSCTPCNFQKSNKNALVADDEIQRHVARWGRGRVPWGDVSPKFKRRIPRIPDLRDFIVEPDFALPIDGHHQLILPLGAA